MELGVYTFGDIVPDPHTGGQPSPAERTRQMLQLAKLTEDVGLDIIGIGEHHPLRYVNSATATQIAAMAAITKRIRLTSACTLLSTADPVRTFQEFATADLVSDGRVEIIFGRGAFLESFPLFGFDLDDYDALFAEKLQLFALLNANERVTWSGKFRPPLHNAEIAPRPAQKQLPVWIGAGSPGSVTRAAILGYPLTIPVLGGELRNYARIANIYREAWAKAGRPANEARIQVTSHMKITETARDIRETFYPYYSAYLAPLFKGRPMPAEFFAQMLSPQGTLIGGSPQETIDKIMLMREYLGIERFMGQIDIGGQPFSQVAKSMELYGEKVAPVIRKETA